MHLLEEKLIRKWLPNRDPHAYKGLMGRVLCIGGNAEMGGAIILAAGAALNSGAGLITVASDPVNLHALHARTPEIMFVDYHNSEKLHTEVAKSDIILIGPGLGRDSFAKNLIRDIIHWTKDDDQHLIIDADGLHHLAANRYTLPKWTILTPHLGEWEYLTGMKPNELNLEKNRLAANQLGASIVLKKHRTELYFPDQIWQNTTGNPSMATGGMGDVLAGMIAGFLGQYDQSQQAILSAVYIHSYIGDQLAKDNYVTLPSKISEHIPKIMKYFSEKE